jgi:hypothetical protein
MADPEQGGLGMGKLLSGAAAALLVGSLLPASADTIDVFSISGTDQIWIGVVHPNGPQGQPVYSNGTVSGSLTIDITTNQVLAANVFTPSPLLSGSWILPNNEIPSGLSNLNLVDGAYSLALGVDLANGLISGASGAPFCSGYSGCGQFVTNLTGTLTPVSATPIPDALPLFATGLGLIGLLGWWRQRKPSFGGIR